MENNNKLDIKHIAFIMDGNGRWAKKRKLDRSKGHEKGVSIINDIITTCFEEYFIHTVSLFTFSSENWNRPKKEISILFKLLEDFFNKNIDTFISKKIKINVLGDLEDQRIPSSTYKTICNAMEKTKNNNKNIFNVLFNYGSRNEIIRASSLIAKDYEEGKIKLEEINNRFNDYLYTKDFSDVDLLIRTSGEQRLSNCLLYQIAYAEFVFNPVYWPDYNKEELQKDINIYLARNRRFGKISSDN